MERELFESRELFGEYAIIFEPPPLGAPKAPRAGPKARPGGGLWIDQGEMFVVVVVVVVVVVLLWQTGRKIG